MRLHEIAATPGEYTLTNAQGEEMINELLQAVGNIRPSAAGCLRHQPAVLRDRTRVDAARPVARLQKSSGRWPQA
jgi:hypothetical protein